MHGTDVQMHCNMVGVVRKGTEWAMYGLEATFGKKGKGEEWKDDWRSRCA